MRTLKFFITGLLCLFFSVQLLLAQNLNTRISIEVKDATLPQVLQQIQKKYGYRFSYLNNELPTNTRFSAEIKDKPFYEVLDVLLEKTDLGYKQANGQIIIKKGFPKNKPKATTFQKLPAPAEKTVEKTAEKPAESKPTQTAKAAPVADAAKVATKPAEPEKQKTTEPKVAAVPDPVRTETAGNSPAEPAENAMVSTPKTSEPAIAKAAPDSAVAQPEPRVGLLDKLAARRLENERRAQESDSVLSTDLHLGFVYPLSTNGIQANKYVNKVSAHLLVGTSAGLEGVEFAGFGNVEKGYVKGVQFAGFFNVVANNNSLGYLTESRNQDLAVSGAQFAGFFNLANGNASAGQFAGYMNVAAGHIDGAQLAGFLNISKNMEGVQGAGYMNLARNVKGAQLAGFLNIADTVSGVQGAGFLNVARHLKGTQIGIINVSDTASGVPIGLFNYVHKGGYKKLELYYSDDFQANLAFKLGVQKFHTMLALGAELNGKKRYGYGYGFGSEWQPSRVFRINTDLMAYHVIEERFDTFPRGIFRDYDLNLLSKFRLLGTYQVAKHLAVFAGPTYNVFVSQYQEEGSEKIGSTLPGRTFYDHTSAGGTNVKMWIGFNAGIRF